MLSNSKNLTDGDYLRRMAEEGANPPPGMRALWMGEWKWSKRPLEAPPPSLRLEFDKHITRMLSSVDRRPRIDMTRTGIKKGLLVNGPYWFVRAVVATCYKSPVRLDHIRAAQKHDELRNDLRLIGAMMHALHRLGDPDAERNAGLFDLDEQHMQLIGIAPDPTLDDLIDRPLARTISNDLVKLRQQVRDALRGTAPKPLPRNRPPVEWKRWFVRRVGALWFNLTGENPAPTGTKFPEFLKACWESLGDEMPDEDFSYVLREYAKELLGATGEFQQAG